MPKSRYFPRYGGGRSSSRDYYSTTRTPKKPKVGWEQYSKDQLKDHCRDRQLSTAGNKGELINRLEQFIAKKNAEAASAAEEKKKAAEMEDDAAMVGALEMVEQNQKMASMPQKSDMPLSQSSLSSSQSRASSPRKSTLTQEQKELIERKRQAALLLKRQNSLNSYSSGMTLSQGSNCSSPMSTRTSKPDAVVSSPAVNPYAKPSVIKSSRSPRKKISPRKNFQSSLTQPVLPPLPPDAPPIRQYTLDKLSDMQLKVVEAARPPTATSLSATSSNGGIDQKDSFHPIVRVTAAAGTGKTTTLLHLALRCIDLNHKQLTYVTYSKASAVDAQTRIQALLPDDKKGCIEASTLHSCAMRILSKQSLESELDQEREIMFEDKFRKLIAEVCNDSIESYLSQAYHHIEQMDKSNEKGRKMRKMKKAYDQVIFWLAKSFNSFCIKEMTLEELKDEKNAFRHYYPFKASIFKPGEVADKLGFPLALYSSERSYKFYADQCVVLWEHIVNNGIRTFDTEIKRAQLNEVRIPGSVLLVDECQDLDACQVDLIAKQLQYGTAIFFVGDAAQTIYSFRGAKSSNYMSLPNAIDMCLNKSWRFGPSIARIANVPLFAKEYSPQTNNYLFKQKKQWLPYRIEGARGEEESSITTDSLLGKSNEVGTITFIARTNYALMFKAMEIMGLGALDDDSDGDEIMSKMMPDIHVPLHLDNVPKFHINGEGDLSGLKRWRKTSKEIRHLFDVFETRTTGEGITLPEKEFPDFANKTITWKDFNEDCKNLELNKYVQPIQIISKYGKNTIKALEAFEVEVLDKKYSAEEAEIILTTCHSAKGLEWDNVEVCDDFINLTTKSYTQNAPLRNGPEFLSTEVCKKPRAGWQMNLQSYGDDINLLYVACTRAKKTLVVPQTIKNLFADADLIHYLVRDMMTTTKGAGKAIPTKDDPSSYTSLNKKGKNDGRLSKGELWHLFNDVCKPLRAELGVDVDDGILSSLFPGNSYTNDRAAEDIKPSNPIIEEKKIAS
mmetsp:Transcript_18431/g.31190  ORF Transcript_18431/g.31190 Transcript_18431/m.31190 type:complete len:1010 (+) Transcript_18431:1561-4590(+)